MLKEWVKDTDTFNPPKLEAQELNDIRFSKKFGSIQDAIDNTPSGGTVIIEPGKHTIDTALSIDDNISLKGFGGYAAVELIAGGDNDLLNVQADNGKVVDNRIIIEGITFKANNQATGTKAGVKVNGAASDITIQNCYFNACMRGIFLENFASQINISGNVIGSTCGTGVYTDIANNLRIVGNHFIEGNDGDAEEAAIYLNRATEVVIAGNIINNWPVYGIYQGAPTDDIELVIVGNTIYDIGKATQTGMAVYIQKDHALIEGNHILAGTNSMLGVYLYGGTAHLIKGNHIRPRGQSAIRVQTPDSIIQGNFIEEVTGTHTGTGIDVIGVTDCIVNGNRVRGYGGVGGKGIYERTTPDYNIISDNNCRNNETGITTEGLNSVVVDNIS